MNSVQMDVLDWLPEDVCLIERCSYVIKHANAKFSKTVGPLSTLKGLEFVANLVSRNDQARFSLALERAVEIQVGPARDPCLLEKSRSLQFSHFSFL